MQFQDTDLGVRGMTAEELDRVALERGGLVGHCPGQYTCRDDSVEKVTLEGGWRVRWIGTQGVGNAGLLILVPTDQRTKALLRQGTQAKWERAGLSPEHARKLWSADAKYKNEVLPALVLVMKDWPATRALASHPCLYGAGSGRREWRRMWADVLPQEVLDLSAPREVELARCVRALLR